MKRSNSAEKLANADHRVFDSVELADARRDRLPRNSPFVGTFHRGSAVSNSSAPTFDLNCWRLPASCPYIGTLNHAARAAKGTSGAAHAKAPRVDVDPENDLLSGASTPPRRRPNVPTNGELRGRRPRLESASSEELEAEPMPLMESSHSDDSYGSVEPSRRVARGFGSQRRTQSFADIRDAHDPEVMGLQSLLPRRSGLKILNKLGEGTFGKVALAQNNKNCARWKDEVKDRRLYHLPAEGTQLVLKCVKKASAPLDFIRSEVNIHAQCTHPNIPTLFGHYEDDDNVIMILEFIAGLELRQVLNARRNIPEAEALTYTIQLMRALEHMHLRSYVHRDVSPSNIMVTDTKRLYLIDLGLAVDLSAPLLETDATTGGTLGYMAPEIVRDEPLTTAVDVWAAGCIVYEAVFGFSPFLPQDLHTAEEVQFPDPDWGLDCSPELQTLFSRMLSKSAAARCTASEALASVWVSPAACKEVDALSPTEEVVQQEVGGEAGAGSEPQLGDTCIAVDLVEMAENQPCPEMGIGRRSHSDLGEMMETDPAFAPAGDSSHTFFMARVVSSAYSSAGRAGVAYGTFSEEAPGMDGFPFELLGTRMFNPCMEEDEGEGFSFCS